MQCVENDSFSFPENTILSHDILEGARLNSANVTDITFTDSFPKNTVSYLKRYHRWVRGDTQNLLFLRRYFRNKSGKLVKNNISSLSKYKLFDNVRRAAVPIFAYAGIMISGLISGTVGAVISVLSLFYFCLIIFSKSASIFVLCSQSHSVMLRMR